MIGALLSGVDNALAWFRGTPDAVASGLARAIAKLGIDLQRKLQDPQFTDEAITPRYKSYEPTVDLQIDESSDRICATIAGKYGYTPAHEYRSQRSIDPGASLRRRRSSFRLLIAEKQADMRSYPRRMKLPVGSFLYSALEDMELDIRSAVEGAVREALAR